MENTVIISSYPSSHFVFFLVIEFYQTYYCRHMKNLLLLLFFFTISINAVCQTKILRGDWTVGGRLGLTSTSVTGSSSSTVTYEADPNVGYFLRNGLAAGVEMTFLKADYNLFVASPFIRYYVFPSDQNINLALQGSYGWGVYKQYGYTDNVNQFSFFISPTAFFSPSAAFKLTLGYVSVGISGIELRTKSLSIGGGFQAYF